jgi:hypothetical protein
VEQRNKTTEQREKKPDQEVNRGINQRREREAYDAE